MPDPNLTPYQQAKRTVESPTDGSYQDGQRIVETLLAQRRLEDLSLDELRLAFKGFNWWGKHDQSFASARLAVHKQPKSMTLLQEAALAIHNCTAGSGYANDPVMAWFDRCIDENLGPPSFWHIKRAVELYHRATQPPNCEDFIDWSKGDPIYDPESLALGCEEIRQAIALDPKIRNEKENWLGGGLCYEVTWDDYFLALLETPEYRTIMSG